MTTKQAFNTFLQAVLEAMDNFAIVLVSLSIFLLTSFGYDQSIVVIESNPAALFSVFVFVALWTLTIVAVGLLVRALKKLKESYDQPAAAK